MKRAVLLTGHFPQQKRRPSLLWVSDALQAMGLHVTFVTVGYSWLSRLTGDRRLAALDSPAETGTRHVGKSLTTVFGYAPIHPVRSPLDPLLDPLHGLFPAYWAPRLKVPLAAADLVLVESGAPVMLAPLARRLAPRARLIYRVNDDIRLLNPPGVLLRAEARNARVFDRISTPSPHLAQRFRHPNVTLDPMGIPRAALSQSRPDPFPDRAEFQAVCAGTTQIDLAALARIAEARPNWRLHVLGRLKASPPHRPNLIFHGEQGFETTLAHVAHADIGLAPYVDRPGIEYQTTNSNRILLYRHFGLPILGPDRLCHPSVPAIIGYGQRDALGRCETWIRQPEILPDWSDLARSLAQNDETVPPELSPTSPPSAT
ncbi:glycosyltransferase family 4 protein [Ruegeria sediminis]|uniref:Glycosyltransferase family 4 protein n=1 Tax=Ruegeria sediminis TaxID=2583820 RepID=A0ABY2WUA4_9RHOB|nr:glycosyltransferase family 4 protein [Ruegeria sediminis]TMV05600.1 glycosyltransferase family 4 protein [Ruegeria sediminis]